MQFSKFLFLPFILLSACFGNQSKTTIPTIKQFNQAVYQDNPRKAYSLLSKDEQEKISYASFKSDWKQYRKEILFQIKQNKYTNIKQKAVLQLKNGSQAEMIFEEGKWKVLNAPGIYPSPSTPEELINLIIFALERRNLNLYLTLLAPEYRNNVLFSMKKEIKNYKKILKDIQKKQKALNKNKNKNKNSKTSNKSQSMQFKSFDAIPKTITIKKIKGTWHIFSITTE